MDYKDLMKMMSDGKADPDMTTMLSALSSGGGMSELLPLLLRNMRKESKGQLYSQEDAKAAPLPPEDEIREAVMRLNEEKKL